MTGYDRSRPERKLIKSGLSCQKCGSSDAVTLYDDGTHCFSCGDSKSEKQIQEKPPIIKPKYTNRGNFPSTQDPTKLRVHENMERQLSKNVMEKFNVRSAFDESGVVSELYFPIGDGWKVKQINPKDFRTIGTAKDLFGRELWTTKNKAIVITEGEIDCLSVAQAYQERYDGRIFPVVSIGSSQNVGYLAEHMQWLNQFDEIILWYDSDEQGEKATIKTLQLVGYERCRVIRSVEKDASDVLVKKGGFEVLKYIWNAVERSPASVIKTEESWEHYKKYKDMVPIPWPPFMEKANQLTYGRYLGTITMFAAGTGVGKSTLMKEDIHHLISEGKKVGTCFLEEDIGETVSSLMSLQLNKRLGLPHIKVPEEEERKAWEAIFGNQKVILLDHQGSVSDGSLISKIDYMAAIGCQYIYLDHVTIAVSESQERDTNKSIDIFMSDLLKVVKRRNVWIGVVSHLRKVVQGATSFEQGAEISEDDLKGSGSLKQISFQTFALSRNKLCDGDARNITKMTLLKDRKTGNTGPAGEFKFDTKTGRLKNQEHTEEPVSEQKEEKVTPYITF